MSFGIGYILGEVQIQDVLVERGYIVFELLFCDFISIKFIEKKNFGLCIYIRLVMMIVRGNFNLIYNYYN